MTALKSQSFRRKLLAFSPLATNQLNRYYDFVESQIHPQGRYFSASDHASKLVENVSRVAAILHEFEGFPGDIACETVIGAIAIVDAMSADFVNLIAAPPEFHEAKALDDALTLKYRSAGIRIVSKRDVRNFGPNRLRHGALLDHLLGILEGQGRVRVYLKNKTKVVDVLPWEQSYR